MPNSPTAANEILDLFGETGPIHAGLSGPSRNTSTDANSQTEPQERRSAAGSVRGLVLGKYRVLRALGTGGMGVVYLAEDATLGRKVAVKVLKEERTGDEQVLERFFREARATAALDHPNIVRLHDVAQAEGTHFLVMEYVDGSDLQALVEHTGPLHWATAAGYIAQAAAGLHHAHELGFVHRDIKPANLILAKSGTVKVLDLGLARCVANPNDALTDQLDEEVIVGTTDFLSPEQLLNNPFDARSDVYSLGAAFFALLTARPPFEGTTAQKLTQHQCAPPRDVCALNPTVPQGVQAVVAKMMAKRPEDRYQTAREVIAALVPWLPEGGVPTLSGLANQKTAVMRAPAKTEPAGRAKHPEQRLALGALAATVIGCLLYFALGRPAKPPAPGSAPEAVAAPVAEVQAKAPLYVFDLAGVPASAVRYQNGEPGDPDWLARLPPGVVLFCWKRESAAEFRAGADAGRPWVGVTNLNDELSAQMVFQFDDEVKIPTVPGKRYRVRFEYRAAPGAEGFAYVRNPHNGAFPMVADVRLGGTDGAWKAAALTFRRPAEGKIDMCVLNGTVGEHKLLAVRSVEVFELDPDN